MTAAASRRIAGLLLTVVFAAPLLAQATDGAPAPAPSPTRAAGSSAEVELQWTARNEESVYGYLVYRSQRREGPYRRINPDIIHARHATPPAISSYRFVDGTVEPGRTYYYYLDTISDGGLKQRLSGVITKEVAPDIVR